MSARLRARAAGLIRQLDAGSAYRDQIEKEIARRISQTSVARNLPGSRGEPDKARPTRVCAGCRTENDTDAKFCKNCGSMLETTS
jgi:rRNA maturation endonuclease Nob1